MNGSATISFPLGKGLFNFRTAGVAVHNGKLLMHKTPSDHFWSLPGGRTDMFELTRETLVREMAEETGKTIVVKDLLWIVENFFEYSQIHHHEIGFYYKMEIPDLDNEDDFRTTEEGSELLFHWHPLEDLHTIKMYPDFITADLILNTSCTKHMIAGFKNLDGG
jgi:8-oxo-dGTP pyrophosphatase MutT (NUDIX family)